MQFTKRIIIPNNIQSIGNYAFSHCASLEQVILPNSLTKIPTACFSYCKSLKQISLPDTLTEISNYAFYNSALTSIELPEKLKTIGYCAFCYCPLAELKISKNIDELGAEFISPYDSTKLIFENSENWQKRYYCLLNGKTYGDWEDVAPSVMADSDAFKTLMKTKYTDSDGNTYYYQFQKI